MKHNQSFARARAREDTDTALAQTQTHTEGKLQTMEVIQGFGLMVGRVSGLRFRHTKEEADDHVGSHAWILQHDGPFDIAGKDVHEG